jgi:GTP cyclohydrolase I
MDHDKVAGLVRELIRELGEDPDRQGLLDTPKRVAASLEFLTSGYRGDAETLSSTVSASITCFPSLAAATSVTSPRTA